MGSFARPDWTPQEITRLKELCDSGLYRFDKMAAMLGRTKSGTMYKCYQQGFNNRYHHRLYSYDEGFFSQITLETCYWAGIITTDGSIVYKDGYPTVVWGTAIKDKEHVELFKTATKATHPIYIRNTTCSMSKDPTALRQYSILRIDAADPWVRDLGANFGITHNKTLRCPPPDLPTLPLRLAYIRGFIDGDGMISKSNQPGAMYIGICGVNREMIAWVKQTIDDMQLPSLARGDGRQSLISQRPDENCYYYGVRGFRAAVLFELLRRLPVPNLSRKWDNPAILEVVDYWKQRSDWPSDLFFDNLLRDSSPVPIESAA